MSVYVYGHLYAYTFIHLYVCMSMYLYAYTSTHLYVCGIREPQKYNRGTSDIIRIADIMI